MFCPIKEGKLMKLKATLTLIAASLFLAACDQSGSATKENAKAETAKPSGNNTFVYCTAKAPLGFSPALVHLTTQVHNKCITVWLNSKKALLILSQPWLKAGRSVTMV